MEAEAEAAAVLAPCHTSTVSFDLTQCGSEAIHDAAPCHFC
jgi:hypothetical protein